MDYSHLARKVEERFFSRQANEKASSPTVDDTTAQAMKLLEQDPDMARAFLQMTKLMGRRE